MHRSPTSSPNLWQIALVACTALVATPGQSQNVAHESLPPPPVRDFSAAPAYEVLDVRAGNVLVVRLAGENRALRLIGAYVPASGTADDAARPYLLRLLQGESVYVGYEADWPLRDREDRVWAYVYRAPDGLFVNLELLRLGYARLSAVAPFEHQKLFRAHEQLARKSKKGVWQPDAAVAPDEQPTSQPAPPAAEPAQHNGAKAGEQKKETADDRVTVYVTMSGRKYHRQECLYARVGAIAMTLKDAKSRGFTPCTKCRPPE